MELRRKSLLLVINMAFADLMLGTLSLPIYIYSCRRLFTSSGQEAIGCLYGSTFYTSVDALFSQASLISAAFISSERFWAIYWPFTTLRAELF